VINNAVMEKVQIICPGCQAKYKVSVQGEVREKISFACRKCAQLIEIDPSQIKAQEQPTTELCKTVCKNCNAEFVKNIEDDSELCYQCRIDLLLKKKKEKEQQPAAPEEKEKKPAPEPDKASSRYTFRNSDGLVLGPIKLRTVAVLVREKRITGNEDVSKDGEDFTPLPQFPELVEFFPELAPKPGAVMAEMQIPLEDKPESGVQAMPVARIQPVKAAAAEPKSYHLRLSDSRVIGPLRKSTIIDLIECKFLAGPEQASQDLHSWFALREIEEFASLLPPEDEEDVVELVETVE